MKWASAVSDHSSLASAVADCAGEVGRVPEDAVPDLVVAFVSTHHAQEYDALPTLVRGLVGDCLLVGCSGGGIIGAGREVEHRPGFALAAAWDALHELLSASSFSPESATLRAVPKSITER